MAGARPQRAAEAEETVEERPRLAEEAGVGAAEEMAGERLQKAAESQQLAGGEV